MSKFLHDDEGGQRRRQGYRNTLDFLRKQQSSKPVLGNGKMLVTSIFFFSHNVFKPPPPPPLVRTILQLCQEFY